MVLDHWALVEADLHERYGFDAGAPDALTTRSWRWLRARILGLLDPTVVHRTRLGYALYPPTTGGD